MNFNYTIRNIMKKPFSLESGEKYFYLANFFLSSALPISIIFFLLALIISLANLETNLIKDKWNYPIFLSSVLLIFSSMNFCFCENIFTKTEITTNISNLFNWIPMFLIYFGFQKYLKKDSQRTNFAKVFLMGSIPVLVSCALQNWFNINGPFGFLNNSIIWFMKERNTDLTTNAVAGLFSNPNYTATWLSVSLPFALALLKVNKKLFQKFILLLIAALIIYFSVLTLSRNSIIGIFISMILIIGLKISIILVGLVSLLIVLTYFIPQLNFLNFLILEFEQVIQTQFLKSNNIVNSIFNIDFSDFKKDPRIDIWIKTIALIAEKPFFGWGAGTFFVIYRIQRGGIMDAYHAHNMPLEIAYIFGIPTSLVLSTFIFVLTYCAFTIVYKNKNNLSTLINKSWVTASIIILIFHISDVTYYDGKISILIWTLFAGIKCLIDEENIRKLSTTK